MDTIIAIPVETDEGLTSKVSSHFGKAPFFLLYNVTTKTNRIIKNTSHHFGGKDHPPVLIKNAGATVVATGSMGDHAKELLNKFNIETYLVTNGTAQQTLDSYLNDKKIL